MRNLINKYLKDGNYTTSTIYLVLGSSLTAITFLIIDVVLARTVSVELVGEWKQLILLVQLFIPIFYIGVPEGFKYLLAKNPKRQNYLFHNALGLVFLITTGVFILNFFGFWNWVLNFIGNKNSTESLQLFPFIYLCIMVYSMLHYIAINNYNTILFFKAVIAASIFQLLLIGVLFFCYSGVDFLKQNVSWIFVVLILGNYGIRVFVLQKGVSFSLKKLRLRKDIIIKMFTFGLPLYLASYVGILTLNIDKVIISKLGGLNEFAIYSIGAVEVPLIGMISVALAKSMFPKLVELVSKKNGRDAKELWIRTTLKLSIITYPIIIILMIVAKPLILFLFGNDYQNAIPVFRAYLLILIWRNNAYGAILQAKGKTNLIMFFSIMAFVLNAGLSYILYLHIGVVGVVYATFIAVMFSNLMQLIYENMFTLYLKNVILNPYYIFLLSLIVISYIFL